MIKLWNFVRVLFLEGTLHRTEDGKKLGFRSKKSWGSKLMFAGVTGFLISTAWFAQRAHFELDALNTTAEVLEVRRDRTRKGITVYELTLKWTDHQGNTHVTVPRVWSDAYNVPVGTDLDIDYDPNNPNDVRVKTREGPWYFPVLILIGSAMSFLNGWFVRRFAKS